MSEREYSLVQECTDGYRVDRQPDGRVQIHIVVPARFAELWLLKLSELRTNEREIAEYEP